MDREDALEKLANYLGVYFDELSLLIENFEYAVLRATEVFQTMSEMRKRQLKQLSLEFDYRLAELKREQQEAGRSRLAQYGKTYMVRQCASRRPHWHRIRSFCLRPTLMRKKGLDRLPMEYSKKNNRTNKYKGNGNKH